MNQKANISLGRLLPRLDERFAGVVESADWTTFQERLESNFETLFDLLLELYGDQYDFFYHLESVLQTAARLWVARPPALKALDAEREANPLWFQSESMLGGVCYVDLFAGDLDGIRAKIPYFKELGLTYLHLMPLFLSPARNNDGGYAVSSYRQVNPALGSMEQLTALTSELRGEGISLVLDFVYNHSSDEHEWARRARAGETEYQEFYFTFHDRLVPDAYDATLREIFPEVRRGSFSYLPEMDRWVWTTFQNYQWDLNYRNPAVFDCMAEEMLFLANVGVEVLRMDAVAFAWKQLGTSSENLPQAHMLLQAFNSLARIAAPALLFKSEAIVHPDDVAKYIDPGQCQLSYNPLLMALLWESLATRQVRLLHYSMQTRFPINPGCAWVNYVRCHDDIGWTFSDEDAARLNIKGFDHRRFLNDFYTGRFVGSFAQGLPFQYNPSTGDSRVSGSCASLAGLEQALHAGDPHQIDLALGRILLIHSIILSIGGIPLLYLGDEVATLNDYSYRLDPAKADDSRWVHRPRADEDKFARRCQPGGIENRIFSGLQYLIQLRQAHPAFAVGETEFIESGNPHVFAYVRQREDQRILVLANFSEREQSVAANELRIHGLGYAFTDLVTGQAVSADEDLLLDPYRYLWLLAESG